MEDFEHFCPEDRERKIFRRAIWIMAAVGAVCFIGMLVAGAKAHEAPSGWKYPLSCCSNKDCGPIPTDAVKTGPDGYRVTLVPGLHDFVREQVSYLIPYREVKFSPDGIYHICINPAGAMLCFFAPPRGF